MKLTEHKDRKSGSRTLQAVPGKREELEYAQAEWLKGAQEPFLLEFDYDRGSGTRLYYDVTGLLVLRKYLATRITGAQYRDMLQRVYDVMALCTRRGYPTSSVCFDPDHVYADEGGTIRFAYLPLRGVPERRGDSPQALLSFLGDKGKLRFVVEDDQRHRESLADFVSRTPVMSLTALGGFLEREFGLPADGGASGAEGGRGTGGTGGTGAMRGTGGMRGDTGAVRVPARPASRAPAAFDMVGMLTNSASAAEVRRHQSVAEQALNGVAGISPTATAPVERTVLVTPGSPSPSGTAAAETAQAPAVAEASPQPAQASPARPLPAEPVPAEPEAAGPSGATASEASLAEGAPGRSQPAPTEPPVPEPAAMGAPNPAPQPPADPTPARTVPAEPEPPAAKVGQPEAPAAAAEVAPAQPAPPRHETVVFGRGVRSVAAGFDVQAVLRGRAARRQLYLERCRDGLRIPLDLSSPKVVGRSVTSDVTLDGNPNLSRQHAELADDGTGFSVRDLGSTNGVTVRGTRLQRDVPAHVDTGERFLLADEEVRIVS